MPQVNLAGVSPWFSRIKKELGGDDRASELAPEGSDDILKQLASQTLQPYRPGWAALPGAASSVVGGLAGRRLRENQAQRAAADRAVDRTLYGGRATTPSATPTSRVPASRVPGEARAIDDEEMRIYRANPANPPVSMAQATPGTSPGTSPGASPGASPSLSNRVAGKVAQVQQALQLPMSATKRQQLMKRLEGLERLQLSAQADAEKFGRGAEQRRLKMDLLRAQIDRAKQSRLSGLAQEYDDAVKRGFEGSIKDYIRFKAGSRKGGPPLSEFEKSRARERGKLTGKAEFNLGGVQADINTTLGLISQLEKHPGLPAATTLLGNYRPSLSGDARDFDARLTQLTDKAFVTAFEKLKGAGAITEAEGQGAANALARIRDPAIGQKNFRKALKDFGREMRKISAIARRRAGRQETTPANVRTYNPETGDLE